MKRSFIYLCSLVFLGLVIPGFYTLVSMGTFSHSPKVEVQNVFEEDAPVLRVAADFDFSPYSFYDSNNHNSGLDVELINEIANRLGMKAEITFTDWISCKKLLQAKETDLILGLEIFSNLQGVLKTIAVSYDELLVFGKTGINDVTALKNKKVGLIANSVIEKIYDLNCEYVPFYTNTQILNAIEDGTVDFGICHGSVAKKILEKLNYNIISSINLMNSYPAIGVRDDLPELRDQINDILIQLSDEGFINRIDKKWLVKFTSNVTFLEILQKEAKVYIIYYILLIILILIAGLFIRDAMHRETIIRNNIKYQYSLKKQNDMLTSIANVYFTMHAINLTENTLKEIQSADQVRKYVNKTEDAASQMQLVMKNTVIEEDVDMALSFTDLSTLAERMGNKKSILAEFRGTEIGWFCAQFIAMDYNEAGEVTDVMFTTQSIDEMKKEKEHLLRISRYDELTHLFNRYAYDEKIKELTEKGETNICLVAFDVNGLKTVNDTMGHIAGDELICGAAECISDCFKDKGSCYRMGGDEFLVLMEGSAEETEAALSELKNHAAAWKGSHVKSLSISAGFAASSEIEGFTFDMLGDLAKMADKSMYADKAAYYKSKGIDRRK